ncbi:FG-GAP-like repeat-containing protein [Streptomyces sp. PmtG]
MRRSLIAAVATAALAAPLTLAATGTATAAPQAPRAAKAPVADFNKDGYADLAISAPEGTVGGKEGAGYVAVMYGSASGPDKAHPRLIHRGTAGVPGDVAEGQSFGTETTIGDFDGDGYTDLVVSDYGFTTKSVALWGSKDGLTDAASEFPHARGRLTSGDFNGDGHRDLVTSEYQGGPESDDSGMTISYGPFARGGEPASKDTVSAGAFREIHELVAGDLNGDGVDDLVSSHGFEDKAYASKFWQGTKDGLSHTSTPLKSSIGGTVADVDGDGFGDFVTRDNGGSQEDNDSEAGTVRVDYGSAAGPAATRTVKITQDSPGVPGVGEGRRRDLAGRLQRRRHVRLRHQRGRHQRRRLRGRRRRRPR